MDQYLVIQGHTRFYCPAEQVEYWESQGCTIYAMQPVLIAGEEQDDALEQQPITISGKSSTVPQVKEVFASGIQQKKEV